MEVASSIIFTKHHQRNLSSKPRPKNTHETLEELIKPHPNNTHAISLQGDIHSNQLVSSSGLYSYCDIAIPMYRNGK